MYSVSMTAKRRLSVTVDADLIAASQAAVATVVKKVHVEQAKPEALVEA